MLGESLCRLLSTNIWWEEALMLSKIFPFILYLWIYMEGDSWKFWVFSRHTKWFYKHPGKMPLRRSNLRGVENLFCHVVQGYSPSQKVMHESRSLRMQMVTWHRLPRRKEWWIMMLNILFLCNLGHRLMEEGSEGKAHCQSDSLISYPQWSALISPLLKCYEHGLMWENGAII